MTKQQNAEQPENAKTVLAGQKDDDGYTSMGGGKFAPFAILDVGDSVRGVIQAVRETERVEKDKKGRVKKQSYQMMLDIKLTAPCVAWDKSEKNGGKRTEHPAGEVVCVPSKTMVDNRLVEIVTKLTGAVLTEDDDIRSPFLQPLVGQDIKIVREADGIIKDGLWKGKASHTYKVGWKEAVKA
jgi:hypothetical protein